jgi:hypothetical protein
VLAGNGTLLSLQPLSTGRNADEQLLAVTANLTAIGGSATQAFLDDGLEW